MIGRMDKKVVAVGAGIRVNVGRGVADGMRVFVGSAAAVCVKGSQAFAFAVFWMEIMSMVGTGVGVERIAPIRVEPKSTLQQVMTMAPTIGTKMNGIFKPVFLALTGWVIGSDLFIIRFDPVCF